MQYKKYEDMTPAEKAVSEFSNFVNNYSHSEKEFVNLVASEHRTLQQSMFKIMWKCVEHWAALPEGRFDGRNEQTVIACKELVKVFPNGPYLPLV